MRFWNPKRQSAAARGAWFVAGVALMVLGAAVAAYAGDVAQARAKMAQFREEAKLANESQSRNDDSGFRMHLGNAQNYLREARALYDAAHADQSQDASVLREYAELLQRLNDLDLAAEVLRRLVAREPRDAAAWRDLGTALTGLGPHYQEEAFQALTRSLDIDATSPEAAATQAMLGRLFRKEGLYDLARDRYAKALEIDAHWAPARIGVAMLDVREGKMRDAAAALDALGALPPQNAAELPELLTDALQGFDQMRRWFPDTADDHMAYAKILFRAGRLPESVTAAERAARLEPGNYATWNFIGDLSRQLDNLIRAREAYAKSLQLKPEQPITDQALKSLDQPAPKSEAPKQ